MESCCSTILMSHEMPACTSLPLEEALRIILAANSIKEVLGFLSVASAYILIWIGVVEVDVIMLQAQPFRFWSDTMIDMRLNNDIF